LLETDYIRNIFLVQKKKTTTKKQVITKKTN